MKRLMAAILCLLCLCAVGAQERKVQHRPYIDQRRFHYGFLFGVHVQDLELQNNGYIDPESGEQWYADVDNYGPGFSVLCILGRSTFPFMSSTAGATALRTSNPRISLARWT